MGASQVRRGALAEVSRKGRPVTCQLKGGYPRQLSGRGA
jgi:hypothetical protein